MFIFYARLWRRLTFGFVPHEGDGNYKWHKGFLWDINTAIVFPIQKIVGKPEKITEKDIFQYSVALVGYAWTENN